jgi:colanic acid/amylovoran biosynthesis protein
LNSSGVTAVEPFSNSVGIQGRAQDSILSPEVTIGLLWHSFSSDNLGVGALSESQIALCEQAANRLGIKLRFIVFGTQGGRSYLPPGRMVTQGSHISFKELALMRSPFFKELKRCDFVLDIGEGDSFADIYGARRFRLQIASKIAVLIARRPLVLSPQTIGPFNGRWARWLACQVMKRCTAVFARDGLSRDYLRSIAVGVRAMEAIDVAFKLPYEKPARESEAPVRVGLNVSGLLFSGGYEGSNQFGLTIDYPALVRSLLKTWTAMPDVEVWLIPHVLADRVPRDDDRVAIKALQAEFPTAMVAPEFASPSAAKSFVSGLDFVTGARMHACIAAFSSSVPVVPLAYSRKFKGLFDSLGYPWLADGQAMTTDEAERAILNGFSQRHALANDIARASETVQRHLSTYESYLTELIQQVAVSQPTGANRADI